MSGNPKGDKTENVGTRNSCASWFPWSFSRFPHCSLVSENLTVPPASDAVSLDGWVKCGVDSPYHVCPLALASGPTRRSCTGMTRAVLVVGLLAKCCQTWWWIALQYSEVTYCTENPKHSRLTRNKRQHHPAAKRPFTKGLPSQTTVAVICSFPFLTCWSLEGTLEKLVLSYLLHNILVETWSISKCRVCV